MLDFPLGWGGHISSSTPKSSSPLGGTWSALVWLSLLEVDHSPVVGVTLTRDKTRVLRMQGVGLTLQEVRAGLVTHPGESGKLLNSPPAEQMSKVHGLSSPWGRAFCRPNKEVKMPVLVAFGNKSGHHQPGEAALSLGLLGAVLPLQLRPWMWPLASSPLTGLPPTLVTVRPI